MGCIVRVPLVLEDWVPGSLGERCGHPQRMGVRQNQTPT